ncbi:hypothetical protein D9M72_488990 [compost metagenome]
MLELARVGAAVDRSCDDQQVGILDGRQLFLHIGGQLLAGKGATHRPGDIAQLDQAAVELKMLAEGIDYRLGQDQGA